MKKTAVEHYIETLEKMKKLGDGLDYAIALAKTLLLETESRQRKKDYEAGRNKNKTFEQYINETV